MTQKRTFRHCEEQSDEAISTLATSPFAGMTAPINLFELPYFDGTVVLFKMQFSFARSNRSFQLTFTYFSGHRDRQIGVDGAIAGRGIHASRKIEGRCKVDAAIMGCD